LKGCQRSLYPLPALLSGENSTSEMEQAIQ
jgi:hypothetical protein